MCLRHQQCCNVRGHWRSWQWWNGRRKLGFETVVSGIPWLTCYQVPEGELPYGGIRRGSLLWLLPSPHLHPTQGDCWRQWHELTYSTAVISCWLYPLTSLSSCSERKRHLSNWHLSYCQSDFLLLRGVCVPSLSANTVSLTGERKVPLPVTIINKYPIMLSCRPYIIVKHQLQLTQCQAAYNKGR